MRAVLSWLVELTDLPHAPSADEAARALTGVGLEVEAQERLGDGFGGVVVAEVVARRPHPEVERLTVVDVIEAAGGPAVAVVCGAANVPAPGGRVLWARPGAHLPGGVTLDVRSVRGVTSAGMLCSEKELDIGDDGGGIAVLAELQGDATPGALGLPAQDALRLRDVVFEVNVPASRPDALGHRGIARELAARLGGRLRPVDDDLEALTDGARSHAPEVAVIIHDAGGCTRYTARLIDGLRVAPSPLWLRWRLAAVGVRPLSNLVDVTNYVMFELGQPLHAFDAANVRGGRIVVRRAQAGERLTTLDGIERALVPDDLLICDARGPVALAGVMGGAGSEVSEATTRVLLESAHFEARSVRRTSMRLGLRSESSARFERGVDPLGSDVASMRAARLLAQLGGGRVLPEAVDVTARPTSPRRVTVRASRATALTGVPLGRDRIARLLRSIEIKTDAVDDDTLAAACPTFRPDLSREVDLVEEAIRLHGYEHVPATLPRQVRPATGAADSRVEAARAALAAAGMCEAVTFGFSSPARIAALHLADDDPRSRPVPVRNPLRSEHSVLRTSLLPNLLAALARNLSFGVDDVRLFEIGSTFVAAPGRDLPDEPLRVAGVMCGRRPGLHADDAELDYLDLKAAVDVLCEALGGGTQRGLGPVRFEAAGDVPYLYPGVTARVRSLDGRELGVLGQVRPEVRDALGVERPCFVFELALDGFAPAAPTQLAALSRFPGTARDLSIWVDAAVPMQRVRDIVRAAGLAILERLLPLEDNQHSTAAWVPAGKRAMLWRFTYRSAEGTLTDAEVEAAHEDLVARLLRELPAERR